MKPKPLSHYIRLIDKGFITSQEFNIQVTVTLLCSDNPLDYQSPTVRNVVAVALARLGDQQDVRSTEQSQPLNDCVGLRSQKHQHHKGLASPHVGPRELAAS